MHKYVGPSETPRALGPYERYQGEGERQGVCRGLADGIVVVAEYVLAEDRNRRRLEQDAGREGDRRPRKSHERHRGRARTIHVGPQARALLMPLLEGVEADAPVFASRGRGHRRPYRGRLTVSGYRLAVTRACKRAKVPHWFPAQLRHNGLTLVRRAAGIEAAQAVGGHAEIETTQIYAERLDGLARDTIERIG
jgi:integrase